MANKLVSVDDNLHLPAAVRNQLKEDVESDVSASVTAAQTAATNASLSATAAVDARNEAVAHVEILAAPSDAQVAGYVGGIGGATLAALDARYATKAQTTDALTAVQDAMATVEDLFVTHYREASITATSGTNMTLFCCPFPLRLTSLTVTTWGMTNIPKSDTDWWLARLRYGNPTGPGTGTAIPVATKTTRVTAGAEPAGEAMTAMVPWSFATTDLTTEYTAGQVINLSWGKTGSPPDIVGPMVVTIGYRPL